MRGSSAKASFNPCASMEASLSPMTATKNLASGFMMGCGVAAEWDACDAAASLSPYDGA